VGAEVKVTRGASTTFYGLVTLGALRLLMEAVEDFADDSVVDITTYKGDQREGSSVSVSIRARS
jgi:hypothetical protein